ncbi:ABC transporter permease [Streptomyces sp. NBC_01267]|uniref:ABC transporter permease n=1 Tax=unclassified Streptomyces TaxID=2593676 RepID=UPI002DDC1F33|nr:MULTISPECIES: ABC transporter permease [unclassified Streptomyces]WSC21673.1 ABC transporter permease [Streptomyces sp. NBC_01766]
MAIGRTAGRRAEAGGVRFAGLLLAAVALALGLGSLVAVHGTYAAKEEQRLARTPVIDDKAAHAADATKWLVASDTLEGQRRFSVVYLSPYRGNAPLPPGLQHWPEPGQAVLSPALRKAGAAEGIDDRYGTMAGTITAEGLDEPTERLAYVRPREALSAAGPSDIVTGFGPRAQGRPAPGAEPGSGREDDKPEWMFQSAILSMLVLPALLLLFVAVRTGAHARDRRTALVTALGGQRIDRALVAIGEAALPALTGISLGAAALGTALLTDLTIPYAHYIVSAAYLRRTGVWMAAAPVAALLLVLGAVVAADLAQRQANSGTRPLGPSHSRWLPRLAGLCPIMILLAVRGPDLVGTDSIWRTLISWAGIAGTILTLPAAVAALTAAAGRLLTRAGQTRGLPGTLVAGRRTSTYPQATARLVTGIVVALIVLMQAVAWQGLFASQSTEAQHTLDRIGRTALSVGIRGRTDTADMQTFLQRLPNTQALLLEPPAQGPNSTKPMTLYGDCDALASIRIECPKNAQRLGGVPQDPRLQELIRWTPHGALLLEIRRTTDRELAKRAAASAEESTLAVVSENGRTLSVPAVKKLSYKVFPRGARVGAPGEDQLTAGIPNRDQGRWSTLLGIIGIAVLTVTAGLSAMAEFLRQGRALAPLSVLTGGLRVFRTSAAWSVLAPLALAGLAGSVVAAGLAAPVNATGESYITRELLWASVGVVFIIGILMWLWATTVAVRQARTWRPRGD